MTGLSSYFIYGWFCRGWDKYVIDGPKMSQSDIADAPCLNFFTWLSLSFLNMHYQYLYLYFSKKIFSKVKKIIFKSLENYSYESVDNILQKCRNFLQSVEIFYKV